jgi:hypothetical protein
MSPNESVILQHFTVDSDDGDCMISTVDSMKAQSQTFKSLSDALSSDADIPYSDTDESSEQESYSSIESDTTPEESHLEQVEGKLSQSQQRSILRVSLEDIPVCTRRRSYRVLPPPMTKSSRVTSCPSISELCKAKSSVSFSSIQIREYDQTIGDHPNVSYGPPISLDWNYQALDSITLDDYESNRGRRRSFPQLMMNHFTRKNVLMHNFGYSEADLKKAQKEAERAKLQRAVTQYFLPCSRVEDIVTSGVRKAKRVVKGKRSTSI